jgi:hypothetical protein
MAERLARTRRGHGDQGITLILFALSIVAIMLVVALVIDYSNVRNSRQDNKLLADTAATAGMKELATEGDPVAMPWRGVCAALDYLQVNEPALTGIVYKDGAGNVLVGNPCSSLKNQECTPNVTTTWAWIHAVAGPRAFDIKSGYTMPDASFPEDSGAYAGDGGVVANGGCDQIAVIASDSDDALFGGIAGRTNYSTASRSVGRVRINTTALGSPAFLMLERVACSVLWESTGSQTNPPSRGLRVLYSPAQGSTPAQPGIIHVDSHGTGSGCDKNGSCTSKANWVVNSSDSSFPKIVAEDAPDGTKGIVAIKAMDPAVNGAAACAVPPAFGVSPAPTTARIVSRKPVDDKYNTSPTTITQLHTDAYSAVNLTAATAPAAGYTVVNTCGNGISAALMATIGKVFVNCAGTFSPQGSSSTVNFSAATEIVFPGQVSLDGGDALFLPVATRVYIGGSSSDSSLTVANNAILGINSVTFADDATATTNACDGRTGERRLVVFGGISGKPALSLSGRTALCATMVYLAGPKTQSAYALHALTGGSPHASCTVSLPCPATTGPAGAYFTVSGSGATVRWVAPNQTAAQPAPGSQGVEDLALWTESSGLTEVKSNGELIANGVFFLPNASMEVRAPSLPTPRDAQFIARTLGLLQGFFQMQPTPGNVVQVPELGGIGLVR